MRADEQSSARGRAHAGFRLLIWLVLCSVLLIEPPAVANAGDAQVESVCALASTFNDQARPQEARALLDEHRAEAASHRTDCAPEYFEAKARISLAERVSALDDDDALKPYRDQLATVCGATANADTRDNAVAACDAELTPDPPETWSQQLGSAVSTFAEKWVEPLGPFVAATLGYLAVVYLLARLRTRHVSPGRLAHVQSPRELHDTAVADAVTVTVLATTVFLFLIAGAPAGNESVAVLVTAVGLIPLTLWAAQLVAYLLASRLRVSVAVRASDGKESPKETAHVIGLLNELGARPPQGAQYPSGTDVSALDTAVISALPTGAIAKVLIRIVNVFLPRAPWEVSIDEESPDRETVQVRHNGHLKSSTVVDRHLLALVSPPRGAAASADSPAATDTPNVVPDLHRVSAGIVLAEFHGVHRLPGLGGATVGTSIGLQAVATTEFARDYHAAVPLLARAVRSDSGNLAAALALLHYRFRDATTEAELAVYDDELATLLEDRLKTLIQVDPTGHTLLTTRAQLNRVVARINRAYARPGTLDVDAPVLEDARTLAAELLTSLNKHLAADTTPDDSLSVLRAIDHNVQILAVVGTDAANLAAPLTPLEHHQTGCHFATAPAPNLERALHHLRIASTDPRLAEWRARDPQLRQLRRTAAYLAAFPPEKANVFALPGIANVKADLKRLGITNEHQILAHNAAELARLLGLTLTTTTQLVALARLVSLVPAALQSWRFTIGTWIAEASPTTRSRLIAAADDEFAETLTAGQIDTLKAWLDGYPLPWRSPVMDYLRAVR